MTAELTSGPPPPFEDMVERVRQAAVLIEGAAGDFAGLCWQT